LDTLKLFIGVAFPILGAVWVQMEYEILDVLDGVDENQSIFPRRWTEWTRYTQEMLFF
jgi:hypothetical protein